MILLSLLSLVVIAVGSLALFIASLFHEPDLSKLPAYHPYKSGKAMKLWLSRYDARAAEWPVPSEGRYVGTSWGRTFVRVSGPVGAPALVLLPSANASSLYWIPNIADLAKKHRVYAVDNIYDVGRSVYTKVMKSPDDVIAWLDELFDGLGFKSKFDLMGLSYGGWLTARYSIMRPDRIRKAVLLAPAATLLPLPAEWAKKAIMAALPFKGAMNGMLEWMAPVLVSRTDPWSRRMLKNITDDAILSLKCFKFKMIVAPTVLTDDEWKSLKVPAILIVGDREVIYDAHRAADRIKSLVPGVQTAIVTNASHDLNIVQAALVDKFVLDFLEGR